MEVDAGSVGRGSVGDGEFAECAGVVMERRTGGVWRFLSFSALARAFMRQFIVSGAA